MAGYTMSAIRKKENNKEIGSGHQISRPAPSSLLNEVQPPKIPTASQTVPQLEPRVQSHEP